VMLARSVRTVLLAVVTGTVNPVTGIKSSD